MEILEQMDEEGNTTGWEGVVVSMYEAASRLRPPRREAVVQRDHGPRRCFLFSLACGDIVELDQDDGLRGLFILRSVGSGTDVRWLGVNDARVEKSFSRAGRTARPNSLRSRNCRKVTVTPLGEIRYARD